MVVDYAQQFEPRGNKPPKSPKSSQFSAYRMIIVVVVVCVAVVLMVVGLWLHQHIPAVQPAAKPAAVKWPVKPSVQQPVKPAVPAVPKTPKVTFDFYRRLTAAKKPAVTVPVQSVASAALKAPQKPAIIAPMQSGVASPALKVPAQDHPIVLMSH